MRALICPWLLAAVCLAGCQSKEKVQPYVPLPPDMETSLSTPEKPAAKTSPELPRLTNPGS